MAANQANPQAQAAAGAAAAPTFLLSLWEGDLNLLTKTRKSLWDEGIKPLETKFSGYGKDLVCFLANIKNWANKCKWDSILVVDGKNLLTSYGELTQSQVKAARDARTLVVPTLLATARPRINALMMFHFLYESLGQVPQKKISTCLESIQQDGPLLLKMILDNTYVASQASTFTIKERFYDLNLKQFKWNVQMMNQDVREKIVDLVAAGHASDDTDIIITLF